MLYGDTDPDYEASVQYYEKFANEKGFELNIGTIAGANHNFYSQDWKAEIKAEIMQFVKEVV